MMSVKKVLSWGFLLLLSGGMLSRDRAVLSENTIRAQIAMSQGKPVESIPQSTTTSDTSISDRIKAIANSHNIFGLKLFQAISQKNTAKNTVISPFSVSLALSMLYNGADGETQRELADLLAVMDLSLVEINQSNQSLMQHLENADSQVNLAIANSLWTKLNFPLQSSFLAANQDYYDAEVQQLDFSQPASAEKINNWVAKNTQNKITAIVDEINPNQALFLINAVYFKGQWQSKFNPENTTEGAFYLADGQTIQHPLMSNYDTYQYYEDESLQLINLPYGSGNLGMNIYLPKENSSVSELVAQLDRDTLKTWQQQMRRKSGNLKLPRFNSAYEVELKPILQQLGASSAFNPATANFQGLSSESVAVDAVKHKAVIEVNEEGTEAAATTSVGITTTSVEIPFNMVVNRPFVYTIQDKETDAIVFMGTVQNPKQ